jgi:uncharacterized protein
MLFIFIGRDKPGALSVRMANREAHLAYLAANPDKVKAAGPYLDDGATEPRGSLLVVEAETLAAARDFLASDPYAVAGLFEETEVRPWRWVIGAPA